MRYSVMEIDTEAFISNIKAIKEYVKDKTLIPVIKANGYGTYINTRLEIINNFDIVAVALVCEAVNLRILGYKGEILVLNQPLSMELNDIVKYNITIGLSDESFLDEVISHNYSVKVHLEIETGMNRTGIKFDNISNFIKKIKDYGKISVLGIYTHLSSADDDYEYTMNQLDIFDRAVKLIKKEFNVKYIHVGASNGILNYKSEVANAVRPGIIMYGYPSFKGADKLIKIKPISKLKSKINFIKEVEKGSSIGYSRKFIAPKRMKIATVAMGYADGIRRDLSNKGYVVINKEKAKIIGNICMDSFMVDVTNIKNLQVGMDVYIWDNDKVKLEDIALLADTINYEIISTISSRVPRIFK